MSRYIGRYIAFALLVGGLAILASCATSAKAKAVTAYQSVEVGLGAVQDTEMAMFKAGTVTKEQHQKVSRALSQAFGAQIQFGGALKAWQSGPVPAGYSEWINAVDAAITELDAMPHTQTLTDKVVAWVKNVVATIKALGGLVPPNLAKLAGGPQ